jgi:hypothetical protein
MTLIAMLWCAAPFQISGISTGTQGAGAGSAGQVAPSSASTAQGDGAGNAGHAAPSSASTAQGDGAGNAGHAALTVPVPAGKPPFPR